MSNNNSNNDTLHNNDDAGVPLPDFTAPSLKLTTVAPALGISTQQSTPDYVDYDPKGRGVFVTMCANAGVCYLGGTFVGGLYGLRQGLKGTPSTRFRVQLNSILNHCGRHGSRVGNAVGVFAILYSLFEGAVDYVRTLLLIVSEHMSCCF